jgi:hypothetical protein
MEDFGRKLFPAFRSGGVAAGSGPVLFSGPGSAQGPIRTTDHGPGPAPGIPEDKLPLAIGLGVIGALLSVGLLVAEILLLVNM